MDAIFSYEKSDEDDYYSVLGCDELSSTEQICAEYKIRALECHPDKHPDNPDAGKSFALLNLAKETLCDPEKRKQYDRWKRSGMAMSYKEWCARKDSVHTTLHWAMKKKKEPALEGPSPVAPSNSSAFGGCGWQRQGVSSSSLLSQFRNYQI